MIFSRKKNESANFDNQMQSYCFKPIANLPQNHNNVVILENDIYYICNGNIAKYISPKESKIILSGIFEYYCIYACQSYLIVEKEDELISINPRTLDMCRLEIKNKKYVSITDEIIIETNSETYFIDYMTLKIINKFNFSIGAYFTMTRNHCITIRNDNELYIFKKNNGDQLFYKKYDFDRIFSHITNDHIFVFSDHEIFKIEIVDNNVRETLFVKMRDKISDIETFADYLFISDICSVVTKLNIATKRVVTKFRVGMDSLLSSMGEYLCFDGDFDNIKIYNPTTCKCIAYIRCDMQFMQDKAYTENSGRISELIIFGEHNIMANLRHSTHIIKIGNVEISDIKYATFICCVLKAKAVPRQLWPAILVELID